MGSGQWAVAVSEIHIGFYNEFIANRQSAIGNRQFTKVYPELFRIGSFPINTYGVFLALAFLAAILITVRLATRDGLPRERIYDLSLWMLLGGLIGSKILMFWVEPEYREHPLQLLSLDFLRSGGVFYGGLIGAVFVGYFLMKRYKLPWWKTADACAPGIAIGNFFGRQGCFAAGCCWGKPTNLPWGVQFTELGHRITGVPIDVHLHPVQLYESFSMLIVFFFCCGCTNENNSTVMSFLFMASSMLSFVSRWSL